MLRTGSGTRGQDTIPPSRVPLAHAFLFALRASADKPAGKPAFVDTSTQS